MDQLSIDRFYKPDEHACHRYSYGFHYSCEEGKQKLLDYIHRRFELWNICSEEESDNGLWHLQCYGETKTEISKSERQMFQGKGRYRSSLNLNVTKKWWFSTARKDRYCNIMYVLKDVKKCGREASVISMNPSIDDGRLMKWIDESYELNHSGNVMPPSQKEPRNFQDKLCEWYRDLPVNKRPFDLYELIEMMLRAKIVPWQNLPERSLISAAEAILLNCTTGAELEQVIRQKMARVRNFHEKNSMY